MPEISARQVISVVISLLEGAFAMGRISGSTTNLYLLVFSPSRFEGCVMATAWSSGILKYHFGTAERTDPVSGLRFRQPVH